MTWWFILPTVAYVVILLVIGVLFAIIFREVSKYPITPVLRRYIYVWMGSIVGLLLVLGYMVMTFDGDWRKSEPSTIADFQSELIY